MRITRVDGCNYGAYRGEFSFDVSGRGLVFVRGDNRDEPRMNNNGAAKSTLIESIDWCFWGEPPKGDHSDSVINDFEQACWVRVTVDGGPDGSVVVHREKARSKSPTFWFQVGSKPATQAMDNKETRALLVDALGLDREIFHACVFYAQNDLFHFADTTSDVERMKLVTRIFDLGQVDEWLDRAKQRVKSADAEMLELNSQVEFKRGSLEGLAAKLPEYDQAASSWESERAEALRKGVEQLNGMSAEIERQRSVASLRPQAEASLAKSRDLLGMQPAKLSNMDALIAAARTKHMEAVATLKSITDQGSDLKARREAFASKGEGPCPECGQQMSPDHLSRELALMDQRIEAKRSEWADAHASVSATKATVSDLEATKRTHEEADRSWTTQYQEAEAQLRTIKAAEDYLARADAHVANLRAEMAKQHERVNPWHQKKQEAELQLQEAHRSIEALQYKAQVLWQDKAYYEFWVTGFGPSGLKSYVLDSRLSEMTESANKWVSLLTGGTIWVRFETQRMGRSTKKLSNKLTIRVFRYNPDGSILERNYKSWSGGEKKRVSWAIDFGLSSIIAKRAKKNWDQLFLDEVFKHVDTAGGEAVIDMLKSLMGEKSDIYVIEQDSDFASRFENRLVVVKQNGVSRIMEEVDYEREQKEQASFESPPSFGSSGKEESGRKKKRRRSPARKAAG